MTETGGVEATPVALSRRPTHAAATPPVTSTPAPADPTGTYTGSYRIDTVQTFRDRFQSGTTNTTSSCTFNISITGTLKMDVANKGNGQVSAHLTATSLEAETARTCSFPFTSPGSGSSGLDFQGPATNIQMGRTNSGPVSNGTVTRIEGFSGAIGGNSIVGTVQRSFNFTTTTSAAGQTHIDSYPSSSASVTLTKP